MKIPFTKMHGAGNDYVYVNGFALQIPDPAALARVVSLRRKGIGSDGLILVQPSSVAAVRMEMYNADGSRGEMCGNGIRCVGKYAWEHGLARENPLRVETDAGIKTLELEISNGKVRSVDVDMGKPILDPARIPVRFDAATVIDAPLEVGGEIHRVTCRLHGQSALRAVRERRRRARSRGRRSSLRAPRAIPQAHQHGVRSGLVRPPR
jgi:diaminopimelate epimerase